MRGSMALLFTVLLAGSTIAVWLWEVRQTNRRGGDRVTLEQFKADLADQAASIARLEGENARLRQENETLKELVTGLPAIRELTQEIRTMVWMAYGPNSREAQPDAQRTRHIREQVEEPGTG